MTYNDRQTALAFVKFFKKNIDNQRLYQNGDQSILESCQYTPDILVLDDDQAVYTIGDLHGDFNVLWYSLLGAELISSDGHWIGGKNIVIQLGDMFDGQRSNTDEYRVPYAGEKKIVNFLKNLHLEAIKTGGMVVTMLGNHDIYRLLFKYDKEGYPIMPNRDDFYLQVDQKYDTGIDFQRYGQIINKYVSPYNRTDFNFNQSVSNLPEPNQYLDESEGFHRQLLASCSTRIFLKVVWKNSARLVNNRPFYVGMLASHGEKKLQFMTRLKSYLIREFLLPLNRYYDLRIDHLIQQMQSNNDILVILINSLCSFFLRVYQRTITNSKIHPFATGLSNFLNTICSVDNNSFIWCYIYSDQEDKDQLLLQDCKEASQLLEIFDLSPRYSSCVSGHSGAYSTGKIDLNHGGWCDRVLDLEETIPTFHSNTLIMTDYRGSRAFGSSYVDSEGYPIRQPQLVETSYIASKKTVNHRVIISKEMARPSQHDQPHLTDQFRNPSDLKLTEINI